MKRSRESYLRKYTIPEGHKDTLGIWRSMLVRVTYSAPEHLHKHYADKGIKICDRWLGRDGFVNFLEDMGPRPSPKYSLDRIDRNGNYEPTNCRWATIHQQNGNRSNNTDCPGVCLRNNGYWNVSLKVDGKYVLRTNVKDYDKAVRLRKEAEARYGIVV